MSGRAGRRGLDPTGVVIINADSDVPDVSSPFPFPSSSTTSADLAIDAG